MIMPDKIVDHFIQVNSTHRRVLFLFLANGFDKKSLEVKSVVDAIVVNKKHIINVSASLN